MNKSLWIGAIILVVLVASATYYYLNSSQAVLDSNESEEVSIEREGDTLAKAAPTRDMEAGPRIVPAVDFFMEPAMVGSSISTSDGKLVSRVNSFTYDICGDYHCNRAVEATVTVPSLKKDYIFRLPDDQGTNRFTDWNVIDLPNGVKVTVCTYGVRNQTNDSEPEYSIYISATSNGTDPVCNVPG